MKKCSDCKLIKHFSEFHRHKPSKDGYKPKCRKCRNIKRKKAYQKNKEYAKQYYQKNKKERIQYQREYNKKNREYCQEKRKEAYFKNPSYQKELTAKRRAQKINASFNGYDAEIKEIYKNCPEGCEVDHIHPLINDKICGLHVPWNLQYLTQEENRVKNNKFDGTIENNKWREDGQ